MAATDPVFADLPPDPQDSRLLIAANPNFTDNGRRGRYGSAYLRALAAHAGIGFKETSPDEDVDAIDATLKFARASVEVQVKCKSTFKVGVGPATLDLEDAWVKKWTGHYSPVYVVLVKVPPTICDWIDGKTTSTIHKTVAFGKLFDPKLHTTKMKFTKADQLTSETLYDWRDATYEFFENQKGGAAS